MMNRNGFRPGFRGVPAIVLAASVGALALSNGGCSAANSAANAQQGCSGLSGSLSEADATVQAFANAATDLKNAADALQTQWLKVCNDMNGSLGLDTSKATAKDACKVLQDYITADVNKGVTVTVAFDADCEASVDAQANCQGSCAASASCDAAVNCMGGEVVVDCNGTCSGQCDVQNPSFQCMGTCKGECTLTAAASCTGQCTGTCSGMINGSCSGNCTGTCNGSNVTGAACKGTCVGTCDAQIRGSCSGMCSGSCTVAAGAQCNGTCKGTCSYTPGSAKCTGTCHGSCDVAVSPPSCTGMLNCMASAECNANCQAQASASLTCSPPTATVTITGDDALYAAYQANFVELGQAVKLTQILGPKILTLASKTADTFSAIGNVSLTGGACALSAISVAGQASVSVQVSVSVTGSVTTGTAG